MGVVAVQSNGTGALNTQTAIHLEDAILVDRLQAGELAAFAELMTKYQDRVYNAQLRIVGNSEDARDLTQETFLKALSGISSFRRSSQLYTWLFRIAVNLAMNHRRKVQRDRALRDPSGNHVSRVGRQADRLVRQARERAPADPADRAEAEEQHALVRRALEELDPQQRTVIVLRDIEGFDYQDMAEILDVAVGTIKSRLHRARMALRELLVPHFVGAPNDGS